MTYLLVLLAFLCGCAGTNPPTATAIQEPAVKPDFYAGWQVVSIEKDSFMIPADWNMVPSSNTNKSGITEYFSNKSKLYLIGIHKIPFEGTLLEFSQLVGEEIDQMPDTKIFDTQITEIDRVTAVEAVLSHDDSIIIGFLFVKHKHAYELFCTGPLLGASEIIASCQDIAFSFKSGGKI